MCVNLCSLNVGSIEQIQKKCNYALIKCVCQAEKQLQLHDMSNNNTTNSLFKTADVRKIKKNVLKLRIFYNYVFHLNYFLM